MIQKLKLIQGAKILLVEDNEINQLLAQEILQEVGFVVTIAKHGREAVNLVRERNFAAVLMDVQMPVMAIIGSSLNRASFRISRVA